MSDHPPSGRFDPKAYLSDLIDEALYDLLEEPEEVEVLVNELAAEGMREAGMSDDEIAAALLDVTERSG